MAVVMSAAALASISPTLGQQFQILINVSTVWAIVPYMICCAALWRLAGALPSAARMSARLVSAAALVFNLWLMATGDAMTLGLTLALVVLTLGLWLIAPSRRLA